MHESHCWIILTTGNRSTEVLRAIASIRQQTIQPQQIILIGNGCTLEPIDGVDTVSLSENCGAAAGRNLGASLATADFLCFLDDDAELISETVSEEILHCFRTRPDTGVVALHLIDKDSGRTQRRHVPRLGSRGASRSGAVTAFLEGACAIRRASFELAGGYPKEFFYGMEATDLAWRLVGLGDEIYYLADAKVHHPQTKPSRHQYAFSYTARNRVWLARRQLPCILQPIYLSLWAVLMIGRSPSMRARQQTVAGLIDGFRTPAPAPFDRMSWQTVWRLTRLGRPPVI